MILKKWEELPDSLRCPEVRPYYDRLAARRGALLRKRILDVILSCLGLVLLFPLMILLAALVRLDSSGPAFFRQQRVTRYGEIFRIHKYRTMTVRPDSVPLTLENDCRVTGIGRFLRRTHLDELGQLLDVLAGHMTLVGTRPEIPAFTEHYTPEMRATLLLPAGITSRASILYQHEGAMMSPEHPEEDYLKKLLPEKMKINLAEMTEFSIGHDLRILLDTVVSALAGKGEENA